MILYNNALYLLYDGQGHQTYLTSRETGRSVYFETDAGGRIAGITDWGGRQTALSYDGGGHLVKVVGPSLCVTYFDYDGAGDLSARTDPEGRTVHYGYDDAHRLNVESYGGSGAYFNYHDGQTDVVAPDRAATYYVHDRGYVIVYKDALGRETNRKPLYTNVDATGHATYFYYNDNRRRSYSGDAKGHGIYFEYDSLWIDFLAARTNALGNTRRYEYRPPGEPHEGGR